MPSLSDGKRHGPLSTTAQGRTAASQALGISSLSFYSTRTAFNLEREIISFQVHGDMFWTGDYLLIERDCRGLCSVIWTGMNVYQWTALSQNCLIL